MSKNILKRILSFAICAVLLVTVVYADNVVIGAIPSDMNKTIAQNAGTTYLQNTYSGPGLVPNSANTIGISPIQDGVTGYSYTNTTVGVDQNGVADTGPVTSRISSPAANNAALAANKNTSNVISNGADPKGTLNSSTADIGPTSYEEPAPTANKVAGIKTTTGPGIDNNVANNTPVNTDTNYTTNTTYPGTGIPSYNTGAGQATTGTTPPNSNTNTPITNTDIIIYQCNDTITAVKPSIAAPAALVLNATTRQIYFAKGGFERFAPAALANLVTAYLLLSYKGLEGPLAVTANAVSNLEAGAVTAGLKPGDVITVKDCIAAMFVRSCCDAANVAAENVSGSIPNFVALMNQTVKDWGCLYTNFTNPTGLNNDAQLTCTYDVGIIMDKCTQNAAIKVLLGLGVWQLPATAHRKAMNLITKNTLLTSYAGLNASRMGYTSKAKYTIASELDYNGQRLIAVVLKANGSQFTDSTKLLNFGKVASIEAATNGSVHNTYSNVSTYNQVPQQQQVQQQAQQTQVQQAQQQTQVTGANVNIVAATSETPGTWQQEGSGWVFIKSTGQKANNEWIKQNGKLYCVDSTGYMVTGWREFSNGKLYYFDPTNGEFRYNTWVNVSTGAYYLQADGSLATADKGTTKNIVTSVGTYTIDETGKAISKVN